MTMELGGGDIVIPYVTRTMPNKIQGCPKATVGDNLDGIPVTVEAPNLRSQSKQKSDAISCDLLIELTDVHFLSQACIVMFDFAPGGAFTFNPLHTARAERAPR